MNPKCLQLLRHQQRRNRLSLTFPFLVGAMRNPTGAPFRVEREARAALDELVQGARDDVTDEYAIRVFRCPDIGQPVMSILTIPNHDYAFWGATKPTGGLSVEYPFRPAEPWSASDVVDLIWPEVAGPILQARWSFLREMKTYQPFTSNDLTFIKEAFEFDEDNAL